MHNLPFLYTIYTIYKIICKKTNLNLMPILSTPWQKIQRLLTCLFSYCFFYLRKRFEDLMYYYCWFVFNMTDALLGICKLYSRLVSYCKWINLYGIASAVYRKQARWVCDIEDILCNIRISFLLYKDIAFLLWW